MEKIVVYPLDDHCLGKCNNISIEYDENHFIRNFRKHVAQTDSISISNTYWWSFVV